MKSKGKFITLDGIDGAGKGTQLRLMEEWFHQHEIDVVLTREPGGTLVGESIRDLLLDPNNVMSVETETLLLFAARQQHLQTVVFPALAQGQWVVCDRFTEATYAYQGSGKNLSWDRIDQLVNWVQGEFQSDLGIFLDMPVDIATLRRQHRQEDRFEKEGHLFLEKVRSGYLERAKMDPIRYHVVDANQSINAVHMHISQLLESLLSEL